MKKIILYSFTALLAFAFVPNQLKASIDPPKTELPADSANAQKTMMRLEEIGKMDKSKLSLSENKALHKEFRNLKQSDGGHYGGVYISVGALIIIILLLILIF